MKGLAIESARREDDDLLGHGHGELMTTVADDAARWQLPLALGADFAPLAIPIWRLLLCFVFGLQGHSLGGIGPGNRALGVCAASGIGGFAADRTLVSLDQISERKWLLHVGSPVTRCRLGKPCMWHGGDVARLSCFSARQITARHA